VGSSKKQCAALGSGRGKTGREVPLSPASPPFFFVSVLRAAFSLLATKLNARKRLGKVLNELQNKPGLNSTALVLHTLSLTGYGGGECSSDFSPLRGGRVPY